MKRIAMKARANLLRLAPLVGTIMLAGQVSADPVTLRGADGTLNLTGELIGFDSEYYIIQTALGDLRVASDRVTCEGAACPAIEQVAADVIAGGADVLSEGLMPLLLAGFATETGAEARNQTKQSGAGFTSTLTGQQGFGAEIGTFEIISGDSDVAFDGLTDASFKIGLSSRRITPEEARTLSAAGAGNMIDPNQEHIVAVDSLVVIVNQNNPVQSLSVEDLAALYTGRISNWSQLGGSNLPVELVTLSDRDTSAVFEQGIFGTNGTTALTSNFRADDNVEAAIYVDENPGAIAFVGYAFKRGQKPLDIVSSCGIGTSPDAFSVKTEEYALFRRLYLYTTAKLDDPLAQDFVDFATSPAASNVIIQSGFIDLNIERVAQGLNGPRALRIDGSGNGSFENRIVDAMIEKLADNDRLSSTFRFRTGSSDLDPRGIVDLDRLITYLEGVPAGSEVTFAGFADSYGAFEPNLVLSENRATQVRDQLLARASDRLDGLSFNVAGYGEIAPSACNTSDAGRSINRRVETWIKTP